MKNTLIHDGATQLLLANVNDGTNRLFINDMEIPSSSWVGDGTYTQVINGITISIAKIADLNINIMLQKISNTTYRLVGKESEPNIQFSHIGQIIYSTTLDTLEKVQAIYGSDTTWIQHSGYMLRGYDRYIYPGRSQADGGTDTIIPSGTISGGAVQSHILTEYEIPSHRHAMSNNGTSTVTGSGSGGFTVEGSYDGRNPKYSSYAGGGHGHTHGFTQPSFEGDDVSIMPPYKNVYIWERTA